MAKQNFSLLLLLSFVTLCTAITIICTVFLPKIVPKESHCVDHDVINSEGFMKLNNVNGETLELRLNTKHTSKKYGKYYYCDAAIQQANATCKTYRWQLNQYIRSVTDCFQLSKQWYGGSVLWRQEWPINKANQSEAPFIPGDIYKQQYGGVMERFWIGAGGFSIFVEHDVPLLVEMNGEEICLTGTRDEAAFDMAVREADAPLLAYTVCSAPDIKTLYTSLRYWNLSDSHPERELFAKPIWSTWAYLKQNITAKSVLDYAKNISSYNFSCSQIEIDDKWSTNYGDHDFDKSRFPNPSELVREIHQLGYNVTIWVHPFVNQDSDAYQDGIKKMQDGQNYLVATQDNDTRPGYTNWWRGENSTLIDVTNSTQTGSQQLENRLLELRRAGIDSFKFDGGEANWLPRGALLAVRNVNPGWYANAWSQLASRSDTEKRRQETRVGFHAQHLPMLVRTMDKDSHWGLDNGLKAVVTSALTHCLIGYNFLLPDMVGGNAYCDDTGLEGHCNPSKELFLRWLQLSVFMPSLQFSVPPWEYDSEVVRITQKLLSIREEKRFVLNMDKALDDAKQGTPIVRPIWWEEQKMYDINDQYLLGDSILVAPILNPNVTTRKVYFPEGEWRSWFDQKVHTGPGFKEIEILIDSAPAFENVK